MATLWPVSTCSATLTCADGRGAPRRARFLLSQPPTPAWCACPISPDARVAAHLLGESWGFSELERASSSAKWCSTTHLAERADAERLAEPVVREEVDRLAVPRRRRCLLLLLLLRVERSGSRLARAIAEARLRLAVRRSHFHALLSRCVLLLLDGALPLLGAALVSTCSLCAMQLSASRLWLDGSGVVAVVGVAGTLLCCWRKKSKPSGRRLVLTALRAQGACIPPAIAPTCPCMKGMRPRGTRTGERGRVPHRAPRTSLAAGVVGVCVRAVRLCSSSLPLLPSCRAVQIAVFFGQDSARHAREREHRLGEQHTAHPHRPRT